MFYHVLTAPCALCCSRRKKHKKHNYASKNKKVVVVPRAGSGRRSGAAAGARKLGVGDRRRAPNRGARRPRRDLLRRLMMETPRFCVEAQIGSRILRVICRPPTELKVPRRGARIPESPLAVTFASERPSEAQSSEGLGPKPTAVVRGPESVLHGTFRTDSATAPES